MQLRNIGKLTIMTVTITLLLFIVLAKNKEAIHLLFDLSLTRSRLFSTTVDLILIFAND